MSDRMRLIPFEKMLSWVLSELKERTQFLVSTEANFIKIKAAAIPSCLEKSWQPLWALQQDPIRSWRRILWLRI